MYDTVLLPTDGSEAAADAAVHAFSHARRYDATVHVLSVVELSGGLGLADRDSERIERLRAERAGAAAELVEGADDDTVDVEITVEVGSPARVITDYAARIGADLAVMSTHARSGANRFLFGSVTERVIQDSNTPVLAVQRE
jgi:nucleotide-binding universal stress UspA family protein